MVDIGAEQIVVVAHDDAITSIDAAALVVLDIEDGSCCVCFFDQRTVPVKPVVRDA